MARKRRSKPKGFDSAFEKSLADGPLQNLDYHTETICYVVPESSHKYTPDFVYTDDDGNVIYLEAKGRFRTSQEAKKYLHIRNSLDPTTESLEFIFMNPATPMPGAQRRKCGTRQSVSEWADKNNFVWYTPDTLPWSSD